MRMPWPVGLALAVMVLGLIAAEVFAIMHYIARI